MLEFEKLTPQVYYKESRDFQLFGRIYDVIFNYLKNNTLAIRDLATNINTESKLLELMCNTLGFKTKHDYNDLELSALCSIFLKCMKSKGSIRSIKLLLDMITSIENSSSEAKIIKDYEGKSLSILIPSDITDWTLIRDVMDYIMPAGSSYILQSQNLIEGKAKSEIQISSNVSHTGSWSPVSAAILKVIDNQEIVNNQKVVNQEIVNYNVSLEVDEDTGIPTTGDIVTGAVNPNIYSVDSRITALDIRDNNDQDRISEKLASATTENQNTEE